VGVKRIVREVVLGQTGCVEKDDHTALLIFYANQCDILVVIGWAANAVDVNIAIKMRLIRTTEKRLCMNFLLKN